MTQKHFGIAFIILVIVAVVVLVFTRFSGSQSSPLPTPAASTDSLFAQPQQTQSPGQFQNQNNAKASQAQVNQYSAFPGVLPVAQLKNKKAVIQTNKGEIDFEIYPEATKAASNFIILTANKYYDGLTFHRVENWVVQGGDPTGTGRGGPGYKFEDEPVTRSYETGIVAMANSGPNTNGSQFFILTKDTPLEPKYTIFGKVILGQEVVGKIAVGDVMSVVTIEPLR